jgi:malonate transporter and related proteins
MPAEGRVPSLEVHSEEYQHTRMAEGDFHSMLAQILTVIVPIYFVLLLGYVAGRAKAFDKDQVAGINELVLGFALPASLFVGTITTPRAQLLQQGPLFLAMLISVVGLYVTAFFISRLLFRHNLGDATLQAMVASFGAGPFFGPAVLGGLFGASSAIAISLFALILNIIIVPLTLVLLELSQRSAGFGTKSSIGSVLAPAMVGAIKPPFVWAPVLAMVLVFIGMTVPPLIDAALSLIGQTTSGVALFVAGLAMAPHKTSVNREVSVNAVLKMVAEPALFWLLALALGIQQPYRHEGFLLTLLPSGPVALLLATRYETYESEASSTVVLTMLALILTLPIGLWVIGGT